MHYHIQNRRSFLTFLDKNEATHCASRLNDGHGKPPVVKECSCRSWEDHYYKGRKAG